MDDALDILGPIRAVKRKDALWLDGTMYSKKDGKQRRICKQDVIEAAMSMERKRAGVE